MIAIFVDCNGVISEEREDYIKSPEQFVFLPGSLEAIRILTAAGFPVIIVSNQAGIAKGRFGLKDLDEIHKKMINGIISAGGLVLDTYYCIHYPDCRFRKPNNCMIGDAAERHGIELKGSYVIGDRDSDIMAGKKLGCTTILVKTGYGNRYPRSFADIIEDNLFSAAHKIVEASGRKPAPWKKLSRRYRLV
jgi:histidinol-phosphate phosphatase family protein